MAVNKAMLVNLLMNSAPMLLSALQQGSKQYPDYPNYTFNKLNTLNDRGYDMGIVQDDMLNNLNKTYAYSKMDMPTAASVAIGRISDYATEADYPDWRPSGLFPSDDLAVFEGLDSIDPVHASKTLNMMDSNELNNLYKMNKERPALSSAFAMLSKNPKIGIK